MPLTVCDGSYGKVADASRWLSVRLAAISRKADLRCKSAALQVWLRIYITNNVGPAHFVTLCVYISYLEKEFNVIAFTLFCNTFKFIVTVHISFMVIYLNAGM